MKSKLNISLGTKVVSKWRSVTAWGSSMFWMCYSSIAFAGGDGGIIPIDTKYIPTGGDKGFSDVLLNLFVNFLLPAVLIIGGIWSLWSAISGAMKANKQAEIDKDPTVLKEALIRNAIMLVFVGVCLGLLYVARTKMQNMIGGS